MNPYGDIINRQRPPSGRPRMQRQERAKLFAPFAALTGFEKAIELCRENMKPQETERVPVEEI